MKKQTAISRSRSRGWWETVRTLVYAVAIATEMDLPLERIEVIRRSAYLHDIGKLALHHACGEVYTEIFKARPDVNAAVHCHAAMCVALSLAELPIDWVHMQSSRFKGGTPIFPRPIYILDESEGAVCDQTVHQFHT